MQLDIILSKQRNIGMKPKERGMKRIIYSMTILAGLSWVTLYPMSEEDFEAEMSEWVFVEKPTQQEEASFWNFVHSSLAKSSSPSLQNAARKMKTFMGHLETAYMKAQEVQNDVRRFVELGKREWQKAQEYYQRIMTSARTVPDKMRVAASQLRATYNQIENYVDGTRQPLEVLKTLNTSAYSSTAALVEGLRTTNGYLLMLADKLDSLAEVAAGFVGG